MTYIWQNQLHLYEIRYILYPGYAYLWLNHAPNSPFAPSERTCQEHRHETPRPLGSVRTIYSKPTTVSMWSDHPCVFPKINTYIVTYHLIVPVLFPQRTGMQKILDPKFMSRWNNFHPFQKLPIPISPPFGKDGCSKTSCLTGSFSCLNFRVI